MVWQIVQCPRELLVDVSKALKLRWAPSKSQKPWLMAREHYYEKVGK
jgi:hypothetical protein